MILCEHCAHKEVCSMRQDMEKLAHELADKMKLLEYKHFGVNLKCEHYRDERPAVHRGQ